ncbi:MAG: saccharopine dehydrogenase NADP-binding domain-containing protein [Elusimicrobia bacterium]|nr:saccharopine dehydrogenase NADP-binding domain-containing protein [Elusimicrobiota bacterium]
MKIMVIGSGMQGRACAFDLLRNPRLKTVVLADNSAKSLDEARRFLRSGKVEIVRMDASDLARVKKVAQDCDVMVSAVPYFFNLDLAKAAVAAKTHFVDLGGNTDIVLRELGLHPQAARAGVTLLPDVGLGPGMTTTIAVHGMNQLDTVEDVLIRDGGLPQQPRPPMNYLLTFSEHGLINEYVEDAVAIRDGKRVKVPGLSEIETLDIPGLGVMEAAHAAGGLSTLALTYEGRVRNMDCKLIRYPGHCQVISAMNAMGFFDQRRVRLDGATIAPRALSAKLFRDHFHRPSDKDLVVIHTKVRGLAGGRRVEILYRMLDKYDDVHRMTAMTRTTGFPVSIVAQMLADGRINKPGAYPVETGIPPDAFLAEMKARGFNLSWETRPV